jgi:phosphinothricin acetyltransferase
MASAAAEAVRVRPATAADGDALATIYNHYIRETIVTFEEEPLRGAEMARRVAEVHEGSLPWLVAEETGRVLGYAYARQWQVRSAYRFSNEITVYLDREHTGRGLGTKLYERLFPELEARGVHAVIGGISLPNEASVAIHERFGLRKAAHFAEVGFKLGRWIDVGYWQRML